MQNTGVNVKAKHLQATVRPLLKISFSVSCFVTYVAMYIYTLIIALNSTLLLQSL